MRDTGLELSGCTVDLARKLVLRGEESAPLTNLETKLLGYLATNVGRIVDIDELLTEVWGYRVGVQTNSVKTTIFRLRKKIEVDPSNPQHLLTAGPGYRFEHRPVRETRAVRIALPLECDRFVGRESEVSLLNTLLGDGHRVVAILGPGGIGKTRLALHFSRAMAEAGNQSVGWCDLSAARSLDLMLQAVSETLEIPLIQSASTKDSIDRIANVLERRAPLLLVLDNFEDIVDVGRDAISTWLGRCEGVRFLLTSRERLGLPGERVLPLGPLGSDDSAILFRERSVALQPGFHANNETIRAIAAHLQGIPLALELAAARTPLLSAEQLLDRIRRDLHVLAEPRNENTRHATMTAAIAWSWKKLRPWESRCMLQLATFPCGCTLELAEATVALPEESPHILDVLTELQHRSLLYRRDDNRLDMYAVIRAFALEQANPRDLFAAQQRHAVATVKWAEALKPEIHGRYGGVALAELALERDNLLAVVERFVESDSTLAARAALMLHELFLRTGPSSLDLDTLSKIPDIRVQSTWKAPLAIARSTVVHLLLGTEEALRCLDAGLAVVDLEPKWEAELLGRRAWLLLYLGAQAEAEQDISAGLNRGPTGEERIALIAAEVSLHASRDEWDQAIAASSEALALARQAGNYATVASCLRHLAHVYLRKGQLADAAKLLEEAQVLNSDLGSTAEAADSAAMLGELALREGHLEKAEQVLVEAIALGKHFGSRGVEGSCSCMLGLVRLLQGNTVAAEELLRFGISLLEPFPKYHRRYLPALAGVLALRERQEESDALFAVVAEQRADGPQAGDLWRSLCDLALFKKGESEALARAWARWKAVDEGANPANQLLLDVSCIRRVLDAASGETGHRRTL